MSTVDTAWLRMEEEANMMMITGVLTFAEPLDFERVRRTLEARLLTFGRFRQRVVRKSGLFGHPRWEADPDFDLDHHVKRVALPAPGGKRELEALASDLMSRPLSFARPLWQFHVVEGCAEGGALICRLHHSIADGVTLVRVLLSLTDETPEAPVRGTPGANTADALASVARSGEEQASSSQNQTTSGKLFSTLKKAGKAGAKAAEMGLRGAGVLGKLAWPAADPSTAFRGTLGREKRAAWSEPLPLADVKAVGRALGGTVNDVLLTAMTGALRRYLEGRGEPTRGLDVRAAVPVNLRPLTGAPIAMGNGFGLVFLGLPVGVVDPEARMQELHRRMDRLKRSPEALLVLGLLGAVGATTRTVEDLVVTYLARKVTAVATNVPGPQQTLYLAGAPLETLMAWVPQAGRVGLGISIISYDGDVRLGMATDAGLVPSPDAIIDGFYREFDALLTCTPGRTRAFAPSAEKEQASGGQAAPDPDRCQATTKAGTQCKLPVQDGARFCHVHQDS